MKSKNREVLAIIFPIYNEEEGLKEFLDSLCLAVEPLNSLVEIHFCGINNGSTDNSLSILSQFNISMENFSYISLTRNFGYEAALESGLRSIAADYYVLIDADGEDPVSLLPTFFQEIQSGNEIVFGIRVRRQESDVLQLLRRIFYKVLSRLADDPFWQNVGEFSMFTRVVRDSILKETNSYPFWRASLARVGYQSKGIPHTRNARIAGKSKLNAKRMITFGFAGLLSTTTSPLRLNVYLLSVYFIISIIFIVVGEMMSLALNVALILEMVFFLILSFSVSSLSIYIARLYKNSLHRPNYFLDLKNSKIDRGISDTINSKIDSNINNDH